MKTCPENPYFFTFSQYCSLNSVKNSVSRKSHFTFLKYIPKIDLVYILHAYTSSCTCQLLRYKMLWCAMVKCPFCSGETKVTDKRDGEESTRRRRECETCGKRFTTYERAEINLLVVKKDGSREPYNREKIKGGMLRACEKRPVSMETIEQALTRIENSIRDTNEVTSSDVGERVMSELKQIDKIAYIRFASVYREFSDISSFEKEVRMLRH